MAQALSSMCARPARRAHGSWLLLLAAACALLVACGDGDDRASPPASGTAPAVDGPAAAPAETPIDERCAALLTVEEATGLFGVDAVFQPQGSGFEPALGQLQCVWETPLGPADRQTHVLQAQLYSGDPVEVSNLLTPELFGEVEEVEGIGDQAFKTYEFGGVTLVFFEGEMAGLLQYIVIGAGDAAPAEAREDDVIELFREFYDRAT